MAKNTKTTTARIHQVFEDLDGYRNFCRDYGYKFNEGDLYNSRSYVFRQYQKFQAGKPVKNQWEVDYANWKEQEATKVRG